MYSIKKLKRRSKTADIFIDRGQKNRLKRKIEPRFLAVLLKNQRFQTPLSLLPQNLINPYFYVHILLNSYYRTVPGPLT